MTTFSHVNIVAHDCKRLAEFYCRVFGCEIMQPELDLSGRWLADGLDVPEASLHCVNLRLPGHGENGPAMEIFQFDAMPERPEMHANTPGLAHTCFAVDDVAAMSEIFLAQGGTPVGRLTSQPVEGAGTLTFQYLRDPEGNIVEILNWS